MKSPKHVGKSQWLLLVAVLFLGFVQPRLAVSFQADQTDQTDEIAKIRSDLESAVELDADVKKKIEELLVIAQESKKSANELAQLFNAISELPNADEAAQQFSREAQQLSQTTLSDTELNQLSSDELTQRISQQLESIKLLEETFDKTNAEINRRAERRKNERDKAAELDAAVAETRKQLDQVSDSDPSLVNRASKLALQNRLERQLRESELWRAESTRFELEENSGLLQRKQDLYSKQLTRAKEILTQLETEKTNRTKSAARTSAEEAEKQANIENQHKELVPSYETNTELAEKNKAIAERLEVVIGKLNAAVDVKDSLQREFRETKAMIDQIGLSGSVGQLLRKSKSGLPSSNANRVAANKAKTENDELTYEKFEVDRRLANLSRESVINEIKLKFSNVSPEQWKEMEPAIESLIQTRQNLLDDYRKNLVSVSDKLMGLEFAYRTIALEATDFRDYINERILWIRSNDVLLTQLRIDQQDQKIVHLGEWQDAFTRFKNTILERPLIVAAILLVIVGLLVLKQRFRATISKLGQIAGRGSCDSFWPTFQTLLATILVAITNPAIFLTFGLAIHYSDYNEGPSLFSALGFASLAVAWFAVPFEFLRRMCRPDGLAQKHLAWTNDAVKIMKSNLDWLNPAGGIIVFAIALLLGLDATHGVDLPERVLFVTGMTLVLVFLYRCLHPKFGIFHEYLKTHERSWATQTSAVWFLGILLVPITFGLLAFYGFYYTALNLAACVFATLVFAIVAETLRALLLRYILVQRRHVHITASRRKREAERELREKEKAANNVEPLSAEAAQRLEAAGATDALLDEDVDLNAGEASRLVGLGMWLVWGIALISIWSDVLPALRALDKPIFPDVLVSVEKPTSNVSPNSDQSTTIQTENGGSTSDIVPAAAQRPGSEANARPETQIAQVTYRDLLIFLVIAGLTIAVARSLPSTLEMLLMNRLPMDRSVRYATKALISYGIILLGIFLAFRALQIGWSNVQWLATALTFGLAFGLQEIFANFVAGIILMFERPIRLGDWITIGDYTGTVTRIRTRATTLVSLDRKEYVVPNKDFITGRLVNWTLSDEINRIEISVGVAYGSNVAKAKEILLEICSTHSKVVQEPKTSVTFQEFGESSLNLVARTFVSDIDCRMAVIDELHTRINDAFIEAQIEISFPQRDLHIRSASPTLGDALKGLSHENQNHRRAEGFKTEGPVANE